MSRRQALLAPLTLMSLSPSTVSAASARERRLVAPEGVVRVFQPRRYDPATAGVVIYIHGLYTTVDEAWHQHHLPDQFAGSRRNALFVVPAARSAAADPTPWGDLLALLDLVGREIPLPAGPLVIAGHSGAYKQMMLWLPHPGLHTLLLLDALYGGEPEFRAWLDTAPENRMCLVNHDTAPAARAFIGDAPYAKYRARCPTRLGSLTADEREAKLLSMDTRIDHFAIVTDGVILPMLLQWSGLPAR